MTEQEARDFLEQQAARSGAKVEQSDITNLAGKKEEDVAKFQQDLAKQYDERGSNKTFSAWAEIFGDPVAVAALVDRLVHHAEIIVLKGESYRLKDKRKAGQTTTRASAKAAA